MGDVERPYARRRGIRGTESLQQPVNDVQDVEGEGAERGRS